MIRNATKTWEIESNDDDYATAHGAGTGGLHEDPDICVLGQLGKSDSPHFRVTRGAARFNLSTLSDPVVSAVFQSKANWGATHAYIFDGSSLTVANTDFGVIGGLTTILGVGIIPGGYNPNKLYEIIFNKAGRDFLDAKAGSNPVTLAFRSREDLLADEPDYGEYRFFYIQDVASSETKLYINHTGYYYAEGYIWVEGTSLAYLEVTRTKRLKEGTTTGNTGTAGHCWVEGDYLHYIDSSGDERRILGTSGDASGKTAGLPWLEDIELHYIDSSGNERYYEGTSS